MIWLYYKANQHSYGKKLKKSSGPKWRKGRKRNRQFVSGKAEENSDLNALPFEDKTSKDHGWKARESNEWRSQREGRKGPGYKRGRRLDDSDGNGASGEVLLAGKQRDEYANSKAENRNQARSHRASGPQSHAQNQRGHKGYRPEKHIVNNGKVSNGKNSSKAKRQGDGRALVKAKVEQSSPSDIRGLRDPVTHIPDVTFTEPASLRAGKSSNNKKPRGHQAKQSSYGKHGEVGVKNRGGYAPSRRRSHSAGKSSGSKQLYAALDLGTNNCRLLIALPQQKGRFRVVDGYSRIVRLGEGMAASGELSDAAMERTLEALKICAGKLINHNIRRYRLIATEACRQASNGEKFLQRVRDHTGMRLEIIDRKTEAYLAAEGCGSLIDRKAPAAVLFDIGGGSSELVLIRRKKGKHSIDEQVTGWTSLPLGVVTLAERYGGRSVTAEIFEEMIEEVLRHLTPFAQENSFGSVWQRGRVHLLGTSGTVTTLAGIHLGLERYERRMVDGLWMRSSDIDHVMKLLVKMNFDERSASPCIGPERADLVMSGCAILEAIRRTWPCERLRVADRGLREGVLTQLMTADNAWLPPKRRRKNGRSQR